MIIPYYYDTYYKLYIIVYKHIYLKIVIHIPSMTAATKLPYICMRYNVYKMAIRRLSNQQLTTERTVHHIFHENIIFRRITTQCHTCNEKAVKNKMFTGTIDSKVSIFWLNLSSMKNVRPPSSANIIINSSNWKKKTSHFRGYTSYCSGYDYYPRFFLWHRFASQQQQSLLKF